MRHRSERHLSLAALLLLCTASLAHSQDPLSKLRSAALDLRVAFADGAELPRALRGRLSAPSPAPPRAIAARFLAEEGSALGVADADRELAPDEARSETDPETGWTTVAFEQRLAGFPVRGHALRVHVDAGGVVRSAHGRFAPGLDEGRLPAGSPLPPEVALLGPVARGELATAPVPLGPARLVVEPAADGPHLAYEQMVALEGQGHILVVDAHDGALLELALVEAHGVGYTFTYYAAKTGSGQDHFGNTFDLDIADLKSSTGTTYSNNLLVDITRAGRIKGYDSSGSLISDSNGLFYATSQEEESAGHRNLGLVLDYFEDVHGRDSFDNDGGEIRAYYGKTFSGSANNATGIGLDGYAEIKFGDGDGTTYQSFTSLDVCAHEFTHAMLHSLGIWSSAGDHPAALHESLGDVFGVFTERKHGNASGNWNYEVGEEVFLSSGSSIRDLDNPPSDRNHRFDFSTSNSAHKNGQIPSYAMVLMAKGGKHPESAGMVDSITWSRIRKIYYKAVKNYLDDGPTFREMRWALEDAAAELYGSSSNEIAAVRKAFNAIGVTDYEFNLHYLADDFDVWTAYDSDGIHDLEFGVINGKGVAYLTDKELENGNTVDKVLVVNPSTSGLKLVTGAFRLQLGPNKPAYGLSPTLRVKVGFADTAPSTSAANVWLTFTPADGSSSIVSDVDIEKDGSMDVLIVDLSSLPNEPGTLYVNVRDTGTNSGAVLFSELRVVLE